MSSEGDASASTTSRGNDDGKGKSPVLNEENQENAEKKSEQDVIESVKMLIRANMAEELAKLKAGSGSGTAPSIPSGSSHCLGEQCNQIFSFPRPMPMR